jgi:hypothetical protein
METPIDQMHLNGGIVDVDDASGNVLAQVVFLGFANSFLLEIGRIGRIQGEDNAPLEKRLRRIGVVGRLRWLWNCQRSRSRGQRGGRIGWLRSNYPGDLDRRHAQENSRHSQGCLP